MIDHLVDLLAVAGVSTPEDIKPHHIQRRVSEVEIKNYAEIYEALEEGSLLSNAIPEHWKKDWDYASANKW